MKPRFDRSYRRRIRVYRHALRAVSGDGFDYAEAIVTDGRYSAFATRVGKLVQIASKPPPRFDIVVIRDGPPAHITASE